MHTRTASLLGIVLVARVAAADSDLTQLDADLEAAYAELHGGDKDAIAHLTALRERAERLTGKTAVLGLDASFIATIPGSKLRVVSGWQFAVVVDRKNQPVAWFAGETRRSPCPMCSANARVLVAAAASPHLVVIRGIETGPVAVIDLTKLAMRVRPHAIPGEAVSSPDGKRLAFVALDVDDADSDTCRAKLTTVATSGTVTPVGSPSPVPHDMCQGSFAVAWRGTGIVVTSDWSEDYATIDVRSGTATTVKKRPPALGAPKHLSRPLCGKARKPFETVGCTVAGRFAFPSAACATAAPDPDAEPPIACEPGFLMP